MVQVKGMRAEVQRFRSERTGRVKYSTSCPWRRDSPVAARRAMPISFGFRSGSKGREVTVIRLLFAYDTRAIGSRQERTFGGSQVHFNPSTTYRSDSMRR